MKTETSVSKKQTVIQRSASWFLCIAVALFPLGQLGRISVYGGTLYLYELFMCISLGIIIWNIVRSKRIDISRDHDINPQELLLYKKVFVALFLFLATLTIGLLISLPAYDPKENTVAILYAVRLAVYSLYIALLASPFMHIVMNGKVLRIVFFFSFVAIIIGSMLQYLYYPDLRNLWYAGWDPHAFRLFGTFLEPVILASVLGLSLCFSLIVPVGQPRIKWLLVLIGSLLLFLTFSRAALIAFFGVLFIYVLRKKLWRLFIVGIGVFLVGYLIVPKPSGEGVNLLRTSTIESRVVDYQNGISVWQKNIITGIGYNHIPFEKEVPYSYSDTGEQVPNNARGAFHSSFLTILATGGIVTFIAYGVFLVQVSRISEYHFYSLVFLCILALFDNVLLHPFVMFWFAVAGLISLLSQRQPSES